MDLRSLSFGVEVERIGLRRGAVANAIQVVVGGSVRYARTPAAYDPWHITDADNRLWQVVSDSSLTGATPDRRAEVISPVLAYPDLSSLQEVVRAVRRAGARVDDHCGVHVHIGAGDLDGRQLGNLARMVYKQEELIQQALGIHGDRLRRYARPIDPDFIARLEREHPRTREELGRIWYQGAPQQSYRYHSSRYHGVNLHSVWYRGTVEFRWAQGTLHAGKIRAYVQFALALVGRAATQRAVSSRRRTYDETSARYDFRVFLLRLGMIGEEFSTARRHLLALLPGDSAFKHGRPKGKPRPPKEEDNS